MKVGMILVVLLPFFTSHAFSQSTGIVADFNSQSLENNLGGAVEVWLKGDGSDETQTCKLSLVSEDAEGIENGSAVRIDYDVDSPNPAYNGIRTELGGYDASGFTHLNFYVKGDSASGFSPKFKIELIGSNKRPSPYLVQGVTDSWQKITIPLSDFFIVNDWTQLDKFVLVFADITNDPKTGTYYLDNIHFSKE